MKKKLSCITEYLSSLSFTVIILIALALTACMNIMEADIFSFLEGKLPQYEAVVRSIFLFFGFSFLYQSWWFNALLVFFSLNLLLCTVKRIPTTIRTLTPFRPGAGQSIPSGPYHETFVLNSAPRDFEGKLKDFLSGKWSIPSVNRVQGASVYFSQTGRYAFLGFYLAHLGLLFILIGGIVSSTGYEGEISLSEGNAADTLFIGYGKNRSLKKLDFSIRLDRCEMLPSARRGDSIESRPYRSIITLLKDGKGVKTGAVEGALTLKHEDIRIAQQPPYEKETLLASLSVTPRNPGRGTRMYTLSREESFSVPETGHTIRVRGIFSPCSAQAGERIMKASATSVQKRADFLTREVVMLEVYGRDHQLLYAPYVYADGRMSRRAWDDEYEFSLLEIKKVSSPTSYSSLSISYEAGANLIWTSIYVAIAGFSMMFLLSHRKLWVKVEEKDGGYHITLAGWSSRSPEVIKGSFKEIRGLAGEQGMS